MYSYHFQTSISDNKIINLPVDFDLLNQDVEVIIIPKTKEEKSSVIDFLDKWAGAFQENELNSKYDYLMEKYK